MGDKMKAKATKKPFQARMNPTTATAIKVEAQKKNLKYGEFVERIFELVKKQGLLKKLKNFVPR